MSKSKKPAVVFFIAFSLWAPTVHADVGKILEPLPCGIYDESVKPLVEKDLDTQSAEKARYTMGITTRSGKKLSVEIKSVNIRMLGERGQVSVFVDDKPYAKTSHQDVPMYLEVHIDNEKYRIICVRVDEQEAGLDAIEQEGNGAEIPRRQER